MRSGMTGPEALLSSAVRSHDSHVATYLEAKQIDINLTEAPLA